MVLYKKVFPFDKDLSFPDYIHMLRQAYFNNFVLTVDAIPSTENYQAQIFFTAPLWRWGLANAFLEGVLLKECKIYYSKGEGHFILQASAKTINLILASLYLICAILFFVFAIFMIASKGSVSLNDIFGFAIIVILMLAPLTSIYSRDKKFWDKVGFLGTKLKKN